jgi:hypothetical protein
MPSREEVLVTARAADAPRRARATARNDPDPRRGLRSDRGECGATDSPPTARTWRDARAGNVAAMKREPDLSSKRAHVSMRSALLATLTVLATGLWATNNASAAKLGERCDGFIGGRCARGLRCDPAPGQCGLADPRGICVKGVRQLCYELYRPVCGCNGRTYPNDCHRIRSRVAKKHDGKC